MALRLTYDKDHAEEHLCAAIIALRGALQLSVAEIAKTKGVSDLSWFNDLKQQSIQAAKGTTTENIPIEVDAGAVRFSIDAVDAVFESLRGGLSDKTNK